MKGQFQVIDTLRHVIEPLDLWDRWLEPAYKNQGAIRVDESRVAMIVNGRPVSRNAVNFLANPIYRETFADAVSENFSPQSHLADMDIEGVDVGLLLPTAGLYAIWSDHIDAELAAALARAYNNYLADYCRADASRLKGIALLPLQKRRGGGRGAAARGGRAWLRGGVPSIESRRPPRPAQPGLRPALCGGVGARCAARGQQRDRVAYCRSSARTATPTTVSRTRPSQPPTSCGSR